MTQPWNCPLRHCAPVNGVWQQGEEDRYGIVNQVNGHPSAKARCRRCGSKSPGIPNAVWAEWQWRGAIVEWTEHKEQNNTCAVSDCGRRDVELHHFAPRNTFGLESDKWPTAHLCVSHHQEWHRRMDAYSRRQRVTS